MFLLRDNPFRVKNIEILDIISFKIKKDKIKKEIIKTFKNITLSTLKNYKNTLDTKNKYQIFTSVRGIPSTKRKAFVGTENRFTLS